MGVPDGRETDGEGAGTCARGKKEWDGQSTNTNSPTIILATSETPTAINTSGSKEEEPEGSVAEYKNKIIRWPLLESLYGLNKTCMLCAKEINKTNKCNDMLGDALDLVNHQDKQLTELVVNPPSSITLMGDGAGVDMEQDDEPERHKTCTIN